MCSAISAVNPPSRSRPRRLRIRPCVKCAFEHNLSRSNPFSERFAQYFLPNKLFAPPRGTRGCGVRVARRKSPPRSLSTTSAFAAQLAAVRLRWRRTCAHQCARARPANSSNAGRTIGKHRTNRFQHPIFPTQTAHRRAYRSPPRRPNLRLHNLDPNQSFASTGRTVPFPLARRPS